jgi:hypothetical protein
MRLHQTNLLVAAGRLGSRMCSAYLLLSNATRVPADTHVNHCCRRLHQTRSS